MPNPLKINNNFESIIRLILSGKSIHYISKLQGVEIEEILDLFTNADFSAKCMELFKSRAKGFALIAHNNIARIAFSPDSTEATKLKASKMLVDIARELDELHPGDLDPATMTQAQLVSKLAELQKEAANRAKPINTGQIEQGLSLNDMID